MRRMHIITRFREQRRRRERERERDFLFQMEVQSSSSRSGDLLFIVQFHFINTDTDYHGVIFFLPRRLGVLLSNHSVARKLLTFHERREGNARERDVF